MAESRVGRGTSLLACEQAAKSETITPASTAVPKFLADILRRHSSILRRQSLRSLHAQHKQETPVPVSCTISFFGRALAVEMAVFRRRALAMLSAGMAPKTGRPVSGRQLSSSASSATTQKPDSPLPPVPPARWLSSLRARIGKCIIFGCTQAQVAEASVVLRALATEWRQLTAGSEGFLTGRRRGLEGQRVAWGEMDAFV